MYINPNEVQNILNKVWGADIRIENKKAISEVITDLSAEINAIPILIEGIVDNFSDLPSPDTRIGQIYIVRYSTGIIFINRQKSGTYISNGVDWIYVNSFTSYDIAIDDSSLNNISANTLQEFIESTDQLITNQSEIYFETVSKNIRSWDALITTLPNGDIDTITYTNGVNTIVKTFSYTSGNLTSIVLSGDTPSGIDLTKTFTYSGNNITSWVFS